MYLIYQYPYYPGHCSRTALSSMPDSPKPFSPRQKKEPAQDAQEVVEFSAGDKARVEGLSATWYYPNSILLSQIVVTGVLEVR